MANDHRDLLPGTLEMLILQTLSLEPMHGYGVAQHIQKRSREVLHVGEGSLYPALRRMEKRGLIRSSWKASETGRRARYYRLTAAGEAALEQSVVDFKEMIRAIDRVLQTSRV